LWRRLASRCWLPTRAFFTPAFERILEFVRKGWLGRPLFATGTSAGWLTFRPWTSGLAGRNGRRLLDRCRRHLVYCLREIFGEIDSVTGYTARLSRPEMEGEDTRPPRCDTARVRWHSSLSATGTSCPGISTTGH